MKRRIREAYRLHWKLYLPEMSNYEALFMFIYIGKTIADYQEIEHGLIQVFKKLEKLNDRTWIQGIFTVLNVPGFVKINYSEISESDSKRYNI